MHDKVPDIRAEREARLVDEKLKDSRVFLCLKILDDENEERAYSMRRSTALDAARQIMDGFGWIKLTSYTPEGTEVMEYFPPERIAYFSIRTIANDDVSFG